MPQEEFNLIVVASDSGDPPRGSTVDVKIIITTPNNEPPKFTEKLYTGHISENQPAGSFVITVNAESRSSLTYFIVGGNEMDLFEINPNSGSISTKGILDHELMKQYNLTVKAKNVVHVSTDVLVNIHVIDENDNSPLFEKKEYKGLIVEASKQGTPIKNSKGEILVVKANDRDSGKNSMLQYWIVDTRANDLFTIDPTTGALSTKVSLDNEVSSHYIFYVSVKDNGDPSQVSKIAAKVIVNVQDVNDSPPEFKERVYEAKLFLPVYAGVIVTQVGATDPDSNITEKLTYKITDGNDAGHFGIDRMKGIITVVEPRGLVLGMSLNVQVTDGHFVDTCIVRISLKNSPNSGLTFSKETYTGDVEENSAEITNIAVIQVKGHRVGEHIQFKLLNHEEQFAVDETSGVVTNTGVLFDREENSEYLLVVQATDDRDPKRITHAVVNVTITDQNDHSPMFMQVPYYGYVTVESGPGTLVKQVIIQLWLLLSE